MVSVYDFIRSAALIIGVGFTAQQDRKTWMWGDSILWGAYALGLFLFPGYLFPGSESAMMNYIVRLFSSLLMSMACFEYLTKRTRDETVIGASLWTRLLGSLFLIIVFVYGYNQNTDKFSDKTLYFDLEAFVLLLVSSVYQFWRGEYRVGGRDQKGTVCTIMRVLFLVMFVTGLGFLAFPTWFMSFKKLEPMEILMFRAFGALLFGRSFTVFYSTSFRYDEDRKNLLYSMLLVQTMLVVTVNIAYFADGLFDSPQALYVHVGCLPMVLILVALYLLRDSNSTQSDYFLRSKSN